MESVREGIVCLFLYILDYYMVFHCGCALLRIFPCMVVLESGAFFLSFVFLSCTYLQECQQSPWFTRNQ